jgi:hypothetical protein
VEHHRVRLLQATELATGAEGVGGWHGWPRYKETSENFTGERLGRISRVLTR